VRDGLQGDVVPLVGVRPEVLAEAGHAFGNLFHRLHYFAQKMNGKGVDGALALDAAVGDLEELLRWVLDYASPLSAAPRPVSASAVVGSLATAFGRTLAGDAPSLEAISLVADPAQLSQAFQLMRTALGADQEGGASGAPELEDAEGCRWLRVDGFEPGRNGIASGRGLVAWALAQKLIEAQGGLLSGSGEAGGVRWSVRLPLPAER